MLRFIILFVVSFRVIAAPDYVEPGAGIINEQRLKALSAIEEADNLSVDSDVSKLINRSKDNLNIIDAKKNAGHFYNVPTQDSAVDTQAYLDKAFSAGSSLGNKEVLPYEKKQPILLVSFSMPDDLILSYLREAKITGAIVAIRGLLENDLNKTVTKIADFVKSDEGLSGLFIDPSLFERFSVESVPTFILPIDVIEQCTKEGCKLPRHAKAVGQSSIRYFLEQVSLLGTKEEKVLSDKWLSYYKKDSE